MFELEFIVQDLENRIRRRGESNICRGRQILHHTDRMTLRRLRWTNKSVLAVMKFSWRDKLARFLNRRAQAAKVADAAQEGETIHDLADAGLRSHLA